MARSGQVLLSGSSLPAIAAFVAAALSGQAHAATLTIGPVEQVNLKSSTVVVLGQTYRVGRDASVMAQLNRAPIALSSLDPGALVVIDGTEAPTGAAHVQSITRLSQLNVPGATRLVVTGVVSAVTATGQIRMGNLTVDITPTMTDDSQHVSVGELVEITGTQPTGGGLFLAEGVTALTGVGGTGTATLGVGGTGTATLGVGGTGTAEKIGVGGTGTALLRGVGGTGTATLGVGGTGTATHRGVGGTG